MNKITTLDEFTRYRLLRQARSAQKGLPFDESAPLGRIAGFTVRPMDQRRIEHRKRMLRHLMSYS